MLVLLHYTTSRNQLVKHIMLNKLQDAYHHCWIHTPTESRDLHASGYINQILLFCSI